MENRLKQGKSKDFDTIIRRLDNALNETLKADHDDEGPEPYMTGQKDNDYTVNIKTVTLFLQTNSLSKGPPKIDALFDILELADGIVKTETIPPKIRACLVSLVIDYMGFIVDPLALGQKALDFDKELFKNRDRLPKDNIFRRDFVGRFIDNEILDKYYTKPDEAELNKPYDPEETIAFQKEEDGRFNEIATEHGETSYIKDYPESHYQNIKTGGDFCPVNGLSDDVRREYMIILKAHREAYMKKWKGKTDEKQS